MYSPIQNRIRTNHIFEDKSIYPCKLKKPPLIEVAQNTVTIMYLLFFILFLVLVLFLSLLVFSFFFILVICLFVIIVAFFHFLNSCIFCFVIFFFFFVS